MTAINFDTAAKNIDVNEATVWTRTSWADSWTERPDLIPVDIQWVLAPESNTATLIKKYGKVKVPGGTSFTTVTPETTRGYFVLIAIPEDGASPSSSWYWLGYAESPIDRETHPARDSLPAAGEQVIPCFGMDRLLKHTFVNTIVHVDPQTPADLMRTVGNAVFNPNEIGNRTTAKNTLEVGSEESASAYAFGEAHEDLDKWSTYDIIEHLAAFHLPTADGIVIGTGVPFAITGANALPTWDAPQVETEGRTVWDILDQLISADRLLSWTMGAIATPGSPPTISSVEIHIETALSSALTIPSFSSLRANSNVHQITATTDPLTQVTVIEDDSNVVDQLVVEGPNEIGIATFEFDAEIEDGWTSTAETEYEDGADGVYTGWASKQQYAQREDNERLRSEFPYRDVYRRFKIKQDWDGTVQSAAGDVFVPVDDGGGGTDPFVPYLGACQFLPELPLYREVDYSGDVSGVDEAAGKAFQGILASIEDPVDSVERSIDQIRGLKTGFNAKHAQVAYSIEIKPIEDTVPSLEVIVNGAPQHALAGTSWAGNAADPPQSHYGDWDYTTMKATLAMVSPRRYSVSLPGTLPTADIYRRKVLKFDAPSLRVVHIAADTIVGFDDDLTPKLSNGGILRDPTDELTAIATMFGEFYLNTRKRVTITTGRRPLQLGVGDMIQSITPFGTVDVQVRSIRVANPLEGQGTPRTEIKAASTMFDPMELFVGTAKESPEDKKPNKRDKVLAKRAARTNARFAAKLAALGTP